VRYRAGSRPAADDLDERRLEITLDVVHTDDAALVSDLQRRLGGGRVVEHRVKEVDYVRDTTVVDVRYRPESSITESNLTAPDLTSWAFDEHAAAVRS
jgi:uncharacterized protein DUF4956